MRQDGKRQHGQRGSSQAVDDFAVKHPTHGQPADNGSRLAQNRQPTESNKKTHGGQKRMASPFGQQYKAAGHLQKADQQRFGGIWGSAQKPQQRGARSCVPKPRT